MQHEPAPDPLDDAVAAHRQAGQLLAAGQLEDALDAVDRAAAVFESACGPEHPDTVNSLLRRVDVLDALGRFAEAHASAVSACERSRVWLGGPSAELHAIAFHALLAVGNEERVAGRLDEAELVLNEALAAARGAHGGPEQAAEVLNLLGIVYKYAARFDHAERCYRDALAIYETADPVDPAAVAALCHNLGGIFHARGEPQPGIEWALRGIEARRTIVGDDHVDLAADLGALGGLYSQAGRFDDALDVLRQAGETFEAALGPDHYEVGVVAGNLGYVLLAQGDPSAVDHLRRALRIKEATFGLGHPDLVVTLVNLGCAQSAAGEQSAALQALRRAEQLATTHLAPDDLRRQATEAALADVTPAT